MVFIAFLNFGISVDQTMGTITGIMLCVVGVGYILLYLQNPDAFADDNEKQPSLPQYAPHQGF